MQILRHPRFGSGKIWMCRSWIVQNLDHAESGLCKILINHAILGSYKILILQNLDSAWFLWVDIIFHLDCADFASSKIWISCKIWIVQNLDCSSFGSCRIWILQKLDCAKFGPVKIWIMRNLDRAEFLQVFTFTFSDPTYTVVCVFWAEMSTCLACSTLLNELRKVYVQAAVVFIRL